MSDFEGTDIEVEVEVNEEEDGQFSKDSPYYLTSGILSPKKRQETVEMLRQEAQFALEEWSEDREEWKKWRRQYKAKPKHKRRDYPIKNASNTYVPVMRSITNTLYGKLVEMFEARDPFWEAESLRGTEEDRKDMDVLTEYMNMLYENKNDLDGRTKSQPLLHEASLMGLSVLKIPYVRQQWRFKSNEEPSEVITTTSHNGPDFVVIPREDVLYRKAFDDIGTMPWFCHVMHLNYTEVMNKKDVYENIDKILDHGRPMNEFTWESAMVEGYEDEVSGSTADRHSLMWDIGEFNVWVDTEDDGNLEDVKVTIHLPTGTVLREEYNDLGIREYIPFIFIQDPFALAGEGTGSSTTVQDEEATAMNNLKNDNAKIANMRVIVSKKSGALSARESLFPGKVIFAENPKEDIQTFQLGEIYPSAAQSIQESVMWGQRATGMSDAMMGFASSVAKSGDTFRGQNQRLQQGQGIFTSISQGIVRSFTDAARVVLYQLVRHRQEVIEKEQKTKRLDDEKLQRLDNILRMDVDDLPVRINFRVKTTDVEDTFESKRQNYLTLSQLFAQFAQQTMPLAQQVLGPQGQQLQQQAPELYHYMNSILLGSSKLMGELFRFFNDEDEGKYVPSLKKQEALNEIMRQMLGDVGEQMLSQFESQYQGVGGNQGAVQNRANPQEEINQALMGTEGGEAGQTPQGGGVPGPQGGQPTGGAEQGIPPLNE